MNTLTQPWILVGYQLFAQEGPGGLKVERLARKVGKSKSSFYHHFADLEVFTAFLLEYHMDRALAIAARERKCANVIPELIEVILDVKEDLFFNRQLRIHRNIPKFRACFEASSHEVGDAIIGIWAQELGLEGNSYLALMVLNLSLENFYLQITPQTLSYTWLEEYVKGLKQMVQAFKQGKLNPSVPSEGTQLA